MRLSMNSQKEKPVSSGHSYADTIKIKGAYGNNLKHIDLTLPKNKLIVFTGLSGSGKSTLAMETLQRECQRQYMESMGLLTDLGTRPKVESIEGLSPAISISQQITNRNPRSTVGTITEIAPFLRVLFSKIGEYPCPHCGGIISGMDGENRDVCFDESSSETEDSSEFFEQMTVCPHCGNNVKELSASHFSFNKPQGACPTCKGVGMVSLPNIELLIDKTKSISDFAITGWDQVYIDRYGTSLIQAAKHYGFSIDIHTPVGEYDEVQMDLLLYGVLGKQFIRHFPNIAPPKTVPTGRFEGVVTNIMRRYEEKSSFSAKQRLEKYLIQQKCPDCNGVKFRTDILEVRIFGVNILEALSMSLEEMNDWLDEIVSLLSPQAISVVGQVITDLQLRTKRIISVGVGYLTLNQPSISLSAGEVQRVKLASVLGSGLTGVVYVLDEPTAGLHQRERQNIVNVLFRLRDMGNTVIVIEHDLELMKAADYLVDFGPGAGKNGGNIVAVGTVEDIIACQDSVTGKYLNGYQGFRREKVMGNGKSIKIIHAKHSNLKDLELDIPLGRFVGVSGVSGAGKTSLIFGLLAEAANAYFEQTKKNRYGNVTGFENLDGVISIDSTSIGRSARSNIATYTDIFTDIRNLFAAIAKREKLFLEARHFSYNVPGGRCEKCQGTGKLLVSMNFLPDVEVLCPVCHGRRYQKEVLNVKYKDLSISDVLDLSIDDAAVCLKSESNIREKIQILQEVGLGYIGLGQSTNTLSGGEAQRLKLAKELSKSSNQKMLYLFDEPTVGLHPQDVDRLIGVFDRLVSKGNSVVVIEHNRKVLCAADWIIDLGPEGGKRGGCIIAQGSPEEIMKNANSSTGRVLSQEMI